MFKKRRTTLRGAAKAVKVVEAKEKAAAAATAAAAAAAAPAAAAAAGALVANPAPPTPENGNKASRIWAAYEKEPHVPGAAQAFAHCKLCASNDKQARFVYGAQERAACEDRVFVADVLLQQCTRVLAWSSSTPQRRHCGATWRRSTWKCTRCVVCADCNDE